MIKSNITDKEFIAREERRANTFVTRSGFNFVFKEEEQEKVKGTYWQKSYYCEENRVYLSVYLFKNQPKALKFSGKKMKDIEDWYEETEGQSRIELIHKFVANGALLFFLRGDDEKIIRTLSGWFAGKE